VHPKFSGEREPPVRVIVGVRFHNPISPRRPQFKADAQKGRYVLVVHHIRLSDDEIRPNRGCGYSGDPQGVRSVDLHPLNDPSLNDRVPQLLARLPLASYSPQDHECPAPLTYPCPQLARTLVRTTVRDHERTPVNA
jgi:hypothetical protein